MVWLKNLLSVILVIVVCISASSQNRFWVASSAGNWNDPLNWSTTSGGVGGASVPGVGNTAIFNATRVGDCNLDIAPTVGGITISGYTGTINLLGNTLTTTGANSFGSGTINNTGGSASVSLNTTGSTTFSGTIFGADVSGNTGTLLLNGSVFNGTFSVSKTDNSTNSGTGGNTFNGPFSVTSTGTADLRLGNSSPDIFNSDVIININNTGDISMARGATGSEFNGNITINYLSTGDVSFGAAGGTSTLADTKGISVTCGGTGCDDLTFAGFTQVGATAQSITLTGTSTATLTLGPNSSFGGALTAVAPEIVFNSSTFSQTSSFTQNGSNSIGSVGGNTFSAVTFNNTGNGDIHLGTSGSGDTFNGDVVFNNSGGGRVRIGSNTAGNLFNGNLTLNNTSAVDVQNRIQVSRFNGASTTINGTTTINNFGNGSDIHICYDAGAQTTFNGDVVINQNTSNSGQMWLSNDGDVTVNGNIDITNTSGDNIEMITSGGAGSLTFGNGTITVGTFSSGVLRIRNFTQTGTTTQNVTLTGTSTLNVSNAVFNGPINFTSPQLYFSYNTFFGTTYLEKNSNVGNSSNGGNTFNVGATIVNSGSGSLTTGNTDADIFNGNLTITNTGSNFIYMGHNSPNNKFNGNIVVNSTGSSLGIAFSQSGSGTSQLGTGKTITVGGLGFSAGELRLYSFTQGDAATSQSITLTGTALLRLGPASQFDGNVTFISPQVLLNGCIFNGTAYIEKNSSNSDTGLGGNTFNGVTELVNSGSAYLMTGSSLPDIFNQKLILTNSGSSTIRLANNSTGTQFNNDVELNSVFGGGIYFGDSGGSSTLAATRTIKVGTSGVISGDIRLKRFTQVGATNQSLNLTGIAILTLGPSSSFGGNVDFRAPQLLLDGATYSGTAYLQKKGAGSNDGDGGNTFVGTTTIVNSGSAYLRTGVNAPDIFGSHLTVSNTGSSQIFLAYGTSGNEFHGNITLNSTLGANGIYFCNASGGSATFATGGSLLVGGSGYVSGTLRFRRFTQLGSDAQTLTLTGTALLEIGPDVIFNGDVTFKSPQFILNGGTFNGTTYLEKTGASANDSNGGNIFNGVTTIANSGAGYFRFAVNTLDAFNNDLTIANTGTSTIRMADNVVGTEFKGNITLNCTAGGGIYFCNSGGDAMLANGKKIQIGASGFSIGELRITRFTQVGGTAQSIITSGTAIMRVGPLTTFNGDADLRSPQMYLNWTTFNGTARIEKTGANSNTGNGGNVFKLTTTIINNGTGNFRTDGNNTFDGPATITNSSSFDISLEQSSGSIYNSSVTLNNNGSSVIRVASSGASSFAGNIVVNSSSGNGIYFGDNSGTSSLNSGSTISVGSGFSAGELRLFQFTQSGSTAQNIILTGTATFRSSASSWAGSFSVSSPRIYLSGSVFNGVTNSFVKNGTQPDYSNGGNTFAGNNTFTNSSTGIFRLADVTGDAFTGNATFDAPSGTLQPAYSGTNTFSGNITTNGASVLVFGSGGGVSQFTGSANQSINKSGGLSPIINNLVMNKASGTLTLNTNITIGAGATFTNGIINTTSTNYLNFADNAIATGANDASYVDGPVRKTGNDAFVFPSGDNGFYRSIAMSAPASSNDIFTAQYFNANHGLGSPAVWDPAFYTVSGCEYWTLDRDPSTSSNVSVTLSWNESACVSGYITDPTKVVVARWNGTNWVNHGNGGFTGDGTAGTVISSAAVTSFSPFTIASLSALNPLPVELVSFKASATLEKQVYLEWSTASELNNDGFYIERSEGSGTFETIGYKTGAGTTSSSQNYTWLDSKPLSGTSYYRLKQVDFDGTYTYSKVVSVSLDGECFRVYPNQAGKEWVNFNKKETVVVLNSYGQEIKSYKNTEGFDASELSPGMYIVRTFHGEVAKLIVKE